ncbi:MAG: FAD-linked oxidase C-terminal domain-containing protein, partial [Micromonosporaceae bacterium]
VVETFETACTWDAVLPLCHAARHELGQVIEQVCGAPGLVNCRFTHVYPDGAAPYFTVIAPGRRGDELAMWDEIKAAASDILHRHGASITHHHAVGRDHRPWYDRQRPDPYAAVLRAAKTTLDPAGILNPGVLIDPLPRPGQPGGAGPQAGRL